MVTFHFWMYEVEDEGGVKERDYGEFLQVMRDWYGEVRKMEPWLELRVPRVLKAVGVEEKVLALLTDGVLVVYPQSGLVNAKKEEDVTS